MATYRPTPRVDFRVAPESPSPSLLILPLSRRQTCLRSPLRRFLRNHAASTLGNVLRALTAAASSAPGHRRRRCRRRRRRPDPDSLALWPPLSRRDTWAACVPPAPPLPQSTGEMAPAVRRAGERSGNGDRELGFYYTFCDCSYCCRSFTVLTSTSKHVRT